MLEYLGDCHDQSADWSRNDVFFFGASLIV